MCQFNYLGGSLISDLDFCDGGASDDSWREEVRVLLKQNLKKLKEK
jgi:hypothetical protein